MAESFEDLLLIRDLALVLVTAGVTALLFNKLRLPTVLGYLAAGLVVGPHILPVPLVSDEGNINVLAQLGVLFLLFSLGLHFHLGKLRRVGGLALTSGILETSLMIGVGFLVANLFGWGTLNGIFLGAILAISSTTIIVKVHEEQGKLRAPATQAIFGILLVEDLVAVLLIALLSSVALTGSISVATVVELILRVGIFVLATLVIGLAVVPRLVDHVARLRVEELLVLLAVGIAFATSMIAVALGLSLALGAFIAGAVVAESRASPTVERKIAPLRDVFTAVFFVSTGILINPADIAAYWPAILILGAVVIAGKIVAVSTATFVAGYPADQALRVGLGMAMIGEFSFIIANLGSETGVTAPFLVPIAVSVSALTALVTPPLIRRSDTIIRLASRFAPRGSREYARMYSTWVARSRRGNTEGEAFAGRYDLGALARVIAFGAVLAALAVTTRFVETWVTDGFGNEFLFHGGVSLLVYTLAVLAAVPIVLGLARSTRRLVDGLVAVIVPPRLEDISRAEAVASVLRNTLYAFLAIVTTAVALAAGAAFLPPLPLLLGAGLLVSVVALLLRGSLRRLNHQLEGAVDSVFADAPPGSRDQVLAFIRERYPWDMHTDSLIIAEGTAAAGRRIRDLQLPQKTGATIITHEREGVQTVNPPPDTLLHPGDTVGILGEREQVGEAKRSLVAETPTPTRPVARSEDGVDIIELDIEEGSPLDGVTLAGSRIRERTGASIVGIRRDGVPMLNPAPVLRLRPGDSIVVLGSPAQVAAVRTLFGA